MDSIVSFTFAELVKSYGLDLSDNQAIDFTVVSTAEGRSFPVFGVKTGRTFYDEKSKSEKPAMAYFAFSRNAVEKDPSLLSITTAEALEDWLHSHAKKDARFVKPGFLTKANTASKFGAIFVSTSRRKSVNDFLAGCQE